MTDRSPIQLTRFPALLFFIAGDVVLILAGYWIMSRVAFPLTLGSVALLIACFTAGAAFSILPFLLDYKASLKLAETQTLADALSQLKQAETLAAQISSATSQWQSVQEKSALTAKSADEIAQRMTDEARQFAGFMQKSNDTEKSHLRLEVEKLRRAETEWLQILVRILDHVFAVTQAAQQSGQPRLTEQMGQFQNACLDTARRVGLVTFAAAPSEPFDKQRHQILAEDSAQPESGIIAGTIAPGYTFQGQLLRRAAVALQPVEDPTKSDFEAAPVEKPAAQSEDLLTKENLLL